MTFGNYTANYLDDYEYVLDKPFLQIVPLKN